MDVTDREQAIVEATATRQRLALLDQASTRIGTTLDVKVTAQELVDAVVPVFADAAVVELVEGLDERQSFDPAQPVLTRRLAHGTVLPLPRPNSSAGWPECTTRRAPPSTGCCAPAVRSRCR